MDEDVFRRRRVFTCWLDEAVALLVGEPFDLSLYLGHDVFSVVCFFDRRLDFVAGHCSESDCLGHAVTRARANACAGKLIVSMPNSRASGSANAARTKYGHALRVTPSQRVARGQRSLSWATNVIILNTIS